MVNTNTIGLRGLAFSAAFLLLSGSEAFKYVVSFVFFDNIQQKNCTRFCEILKLLLFHFALSLTKLCYMYFTNQMLQSSFSLLQPSFY